MMYINPSDRQRIIDLLKELEGALKGRWTAIQPVIKFYHGTESTVYFYHSTDVNESFCEKYRWTKNISSEDMTTIYNLLTVCIGTHESIKYTRLTKKATGYRLRLNLDYEKYQTCDDLDHQIRSLFILARQAVGSIPDSTPETRDVSGILTAIKENERKKKMNDFSLTNLKNAVVDKVTHLDKKTVSILAIIALLLLVVGKYNTIKGLVVGIKDKVTGSDDFKAMVADGSKAIDSLKKIVGVKTADTKSKKGKD